MTDMQPTNNDQQLQQSTEEATRIGNTEGTKWLIAVGALTITLFALFAIVYVLSLSFAFITSLPLWADGLLLAIPIVLLLRQAWALMYSRFNEPPKGATKAELDEKFNKFMLMKEYSDDDKKMIKMRKQANQLLAVAGVLLLVEGGIFATFVYEQLDVKFAGIILALLLNAVVGIWRIYEDQIKALHWSWIARSQPEEAFYGFRFYRNVNGKDHIVRIVRIGPGYVETLVEFDGSKIDILPTDMYKSGFRYRCDRRSDALPTEANQRKDEKTVDNEPTEEKDDDVEVISPTPITGEEISNIEVTSAE
jgi:hypothetical protein